MQSVLAKRLLLVFGLGFACLPLSRPLSAQVTSPSRPAQTLSTTSTTVHDPSRTGYYDPISFWWGVILGDPNALIDTGMGYNPYVHYDPYGRPIGEWFPVAPPPPNPDPLPVPVIEGPSLPGDDSPVYAPPGAYPDPGTTPPPVIVQPPYLDPTYVEPPYYWDDWEFSMPQTPAGLTANPGLENSIFLDWEDNPEPDLASYQVWRSTNPETGFALVAQVGVSHYLDTTTEPGVEYWYMVAAVDFVGYISGTCEPVSATASSTSVRPSAPTGLTAEPSAVSVVLRWQHSPDANVVGYIVERSDGTPDNWASVGRTTAATFTDANVTPGATYYYRVVAVTEDGQMSEPSNEVQVQVPANGPPTGEDETESELPPPPSTGGALNVVDFGASPARTGDDTGAIQRAFDTAQSQNKDVYFPSGYYWISKKVVFRAAGRTVFGDGMTKSVLAGNTDRHSLLELYRATNAVVRDLRFEGSLTNEQDTNIWPAVEVASTNGAKLYRNHSYGTGYLLRDSGGTNTHVEENICEDYGRIGYLIGSGAVVRNNRFVCRPSWVFEDQMNGIYASAGKQNLIIENNVFIHCGSYAMTLWGSKTGEWTQNIVVQQNIFEDCDRVLVIASSATGPGYRNVKFLNNTLRRSGDKSIHIGKFNGSNSDGSGLVIDGNVFEDPGSDMSIFMTNWNASGPITGVRISNNQFLHPNKSAYHGIYIWQNVAPLWDVIIENNTFAGFGHNGSTEKAHTALYLRSGSDIIVRGNEFTHWEGAGATCDVHAIKMDTGVRNSRIEGNTFVGTGKPGALGLRVTSRASSALGSITNNVFRRARLIDNGVPCSGNTLQ